MVLAELKARTAGNKSGLICPELFSWITAPGTALVLTALSMNPPSLFDKNVRIANCVVSRLLLAPPGSLSPNPTSSLIKSITMLPTARRSASNCATDTLLVKLTLPVLFSALIKSPTLKSPSSLVPEE